MGLQLSDVTIEVNDEPVGIEPNSLSWTEGFGAAMVRAASTGGGGTELILGRDISEAMSTVKFEIATTIENAELVRGWIANLGGIAIEISASFGGKKLTRTLSQGSVTNVPEFNAASDGTIEVEFTGNPLV